MLFHVVFYILYITHRASKDIQTDIAFLTTRVCEKYEDDWVNLKRLLQYICSTIYMPLIPRADKLTIIKWWYDALYAVYQDCRNYIGATMLFRQRVG